MEPIIRLSIGKTVALLSVCVVMLTVAGFVSEYDALQSSPSDFNLENVRGLGRLFNLAGEANIPAWYKSSTLLLCSFFLFTIAAARRRDSSSYWSYWRDLGIVFLLLSVDEIAVIHRGLGLQLSAALQTTGFLYYAWVLVGIAFVALLSVFYAGFLKSLPVMPMYLFLFSGTTYVASALGLKMIEGWYLNRYGQGSLLFISLIVIRQFGEMASIVVFIYSLLSYMRYNVEDTLIRVVE